MSTPRRRPGCGDAARAGAARGPGDRHDEPTDDGGPPGLTGSRAPPGGPVPPRAPERATAPNEPCGPSGAVCAALAVPDRSPLPHPAACAPGRGLRASSQRQVRDEKRPRRPASRTACQVYTLAAPHPSGGSPDRHPCAGVPNHAGARSGALTSGGTTVPGRLPQLGRPGLAARRSGEVALSYQALQRRQACSPADSRRNGAHLHACPTRAGQPALPGALCCQRRNLRPLAGAAHGFPRRPPAVSAAAPRLAVQAPGAPPRRIAAGAPPPARR